MRKRQAATEGLVVETNGSARRWALLLLFALFALATLWPGGTHKAVAQTPPPTSAITIVARDLATNAVLPEFTFLVNGDNAHLGDDPDPMQRPGVAPTESNSPVVALGDQDSATVSLPDGRYLISIRSADHKMWGKHITLPADAGTVDIALRGYPAGKDGFPLGKIRAFVFEDMSWANSAPDATEPGLEGFHITIDEQTDQHVTVDYFNNPLCGGDCVTDADGFVQLDNLGPATYFVYATPPDTACNSNPDSRWVQTSTFDGGFNVQAGVEEGSDGTGAPGEQLWEPPNVRTGNWFGFACFPTDFDNPGTGEITGQALNWVGWPPFDALVTDPNEPVQNPYIALSDSTTDITVYVGQGDGDGGFDIQNVPAGTYNMAIWDEQLSYIIRLPDGDRGRRRGRRARRRRRLALVRLALGRRLPRRERGPDPPAGRAGDPEHRRRPALARRLGQGRHPYRPERALRVPDGRGRPARQVDHRRAGLRAPGRDRRDGLRRAHRCAFAGPDRARRRPPERTSSSARGTGPSSTGASASTRTTSPGRSSASPSGGRPGTRWTPACRRPRATSLRSPT